MTPEHRRAHDRVAKAQERTGENISWGDTEGGLAISRAYVPELAKGIWRSLRQLALGPNGSLVGPAMCPGRPRRFQKRRVNGPAAG